MLVQLLCLLLHSFGSAGVEYGGVATASKQMQPFNVLFSLGEGSGVIQVAGLGSKCTVALIIIITIKILMT